VYIDPWDLSGIKFTLTNITTLSFKHRNLVIQFGLRLTSLVNLVQAQILLLHTHDFWSYRYHSRF